MILYDIIKKVTFDNVFSDILRHVPEVECKRAQFNSAFESLRTLKPAKDICLKIYTERKEYPGEGVHSLWVDGPFTGSNFDESLLAGNIRWDPLFKSPDAAGKINDEKIIAGLSYSTHYSVPRTNAARDIICFRDDNMWFNRETRTLLIVSFSEDYENEVCEIMDFANSMLKNPTIAFGKPILPGIEVSAIFITE